MERQVSLGGVAPVIGATGSDAAPKGAEFMLWVVETCGHDQGAFTTHFRPYGTPWVAQDEAGAQALADKLVGSPLDVRVRRLDGIEAVLLALLVPEPLKGRGDWDRVACAKARSLGLPVQGDWWCYPTLGDAIEVYGPNGRERSGPRHLFAFAEAARRGEQPAVWNTWWEQAEALGLVSAKRVGVTIGGWQD